MSLMVGRDDQIKIGGMEGIEGKDWAWVEYEGDEYVDKITKDDGYWQYLDERVRPYPCAEYDYDEDGFELDEENE